MEFIDKIRCEIEQTEYFDGVDSIYIKLMILKVLNNIMGNSDKKTPALFNTVKNLQAIYKEVPDSYPFPAEHFSIIKRKITNILIQFRIEPYLNVA